MADAPRSVEQLLRLVELAESDNRQLRRQIELAREQGGRLLPPRHVARMCVAAVLILVAAAAAGFWVGHWLEVFMAGMAGPVG
jgi:hypothetical protein